MIKFLFQLEGEHLNQNRWAYEEGYIEGDMQITVNDDVFFESVVNVVELGIQLGRWEEAIRHGYVCDFDYESFKHEEPILNFTIHEGGVKFSSIWQQFEVEELVPLEMLQEAVISYLYALNLNLHKLNYFEKLDRFLNHNYSGNAKALLLLEQGEYEEAFTLFEKLVEEHREVQSLNNLAFMYIDVEEYQKAKALLEEVLILNPKTYFPYNMLGEIALAEGDLALAESYLIKSLSIQFSDEAAHNLGIVYFYQGHYLKAASCFAKCTNPFDMSKSYEVYSWLKAGQYLKVKEILASWRPEINQFVTTTQIADFYIEIGEYSLAKEWFLIDWSNGYNPLYNVLRFTYTLMQLGEEESARKIVDKALTLKARQIMQEQKEVWEDTTDEDKERWLAELQGHKDMLQPLVEQIKQGYIPPFEFDLFPISDCYLFGSKRHGHPEYKG